MIEIGGYRCSHTGYVSPTLQGLNGMSPTEAPYSTTRS